MTESVQPKRGRRRRWVISMIRGVVLGVGAFYGGALTLGYFVQDKFIFPAPREVYRTPAAMGWAFDDVSLPVDHETTRGWFIPKEGARGTILYSHGNGECIADSLEAVGIYRDLGFNVLVYDYGGYGQSTGKPSEQRCYDDVRAMWKYLTVTRGIPPDRIVLFGRSLGGGPTTQLATEVKPACVVLESTFCSIPAMARAKFPLIPAWLILRTRFDNLAKVARITAPLLVIHSRTDSVVPFAQGRALYERATCRKEFLEIHGDHNDDFMVDKKTYEDGLKKFFDSVFPAPHNPDPGS